MPQLKETIDGIAAVRPKQMIRIGCEHGSGFIYVGEADMVDYGKLNDICIKKLPKTLHINTRQRPIHNQS